MQSIEINKTEVLYNFLQSLFFFLFTILIFLFPFLGNRIPESQLHLHGTRQKVQFLFQSYTHTNLIYTYICIYTHIFFPPKNKQLSFSLQMSPWRSIHRTFRVGFILTPITSPCFNIYSTLTSHFPILSYVLIISVIRHCVSFPLQLKVYEDKSFICLINLDLPCLRQSLAQCRY